MSMFVCVVRVTPDTFKLLKKDPSQLEAVFDGDAAVMKTLGIKDNETGGFDYSVADDAMDNEENLEMLEGKEDDDDDKDDPVFKDICADGTLDYDAGYGNAFTLSPKAVAKAVSQSSVISIDDEVEKIFKAAAKRGDYIIGVVS